MADVDHGHLDELEAIVHQRCNLSRGSKCLKLSGLRLGGIPRRVLALKSTLRHLYLHRCGIGSDFPHQLIVLINLQTLDLSENGITYLPDSFCITAKFLQVLDMSYNKLTRVPGSIGELESLRELNLSHNKIIYLPSEVGRLDRLRTLDVNSNCLLGLPSAIFSQSGCLSLRTVDMSANQIDELPDSIGNLSNLKSLNIGQNQVKYLPSSMKRLSLVESLNYGENPWIQSLPSSATGKAYGTNALHVIYTLAL